MSALEAKDPEFAHRVRESFGRQRVMALFGAALTRVEPGHVEIELPYREDLTQQHGYLHAGVAATIADSAGGYAAYSLMPHGSSVLAVEFKVNLVAPARGETFRAIGRVKRAGRTLTVSEIEVVGLTGGEERTALVGLQTSICLPDTIDDPSRG